MDKYMIREQGKSGGSLYDTESEARIAAQRWVKETGVLVVLYECTMLTIFSRTGEQTVPELARSQLTKLAGG